MNFINRKLIVSSVFISCLFSSFVNAGTPLYIGVNLGGDFGSKNTRSSTNDVAGLVNVGVQENEYISTQVSGMLSKHEMGYIMAEGLFTIPVNQFITPYVEFGLGFMHLSDSGAGFNAGGGFKVNLSDQLSLSVDYRYVHQFATGTPSTNVLSGGIAWYFDKNVDVFTFNPHPKPVKFVVAD